jgi:hypothetical protein
MYELDELDNIDQAAPDHESSSASHHLGRVCTGCFDRGRRGAVDVRHGPDPPAGSCGPSTRSIYEHPNRFRRW